MMCAIGMRKGKGNAYTNESRRNCHILGSEAYRVSNNFLNAKVSDGQVIALRLARILQEGHTLEIAPDNWISIVRIIGDDYRYAYHSYALPMKKRHPMADKFLTLLYIIKKCS